MKQNNTLVVTTTNFQSFIASLKSNLTLGYGVCTKAVYINGYFQAALSIGNDEAYKSRLASISGDEKENVIDLCDYLGNNAVVVAKPVEVVKVEEQKEAVSTTIKRVPRKPRAQKEKK